MLSSDIIFKLVIVRLSSYKIAGLIVGKSTGNMTGHMYRFSERCGTNKTKPLDQPDQTDKYCKAHTELHLDRITITPWFCGYIYICL